MNQYRLPVQRVQLIRDGSVSIERAPLLGDDYAAAEVVRKLIGTPDREHFVIIGMSARWRAIGASTIAIGAETWAATSIGCILRTALLMSARSFILAHNHPGGDPKPSKEDIIFTRKVRDAVGYVDMQMTDHIIIATDECGQDSHFSFNASGMFD